MDKNLYLNVDMKSDLANNQKYQLMVGYLFYQYILCNKHDIHIHERTEPQEPNMVTLKGCWIIVNIQKIIDYSIIMMEDQC